MDTRGLLLAAGLFMSAVGCVTGDEVASVEDDDDADATPHAQQLQEEEQASKQAATPVAKKDDAPAAKATPQVTGTDKRPKLPAPPKLSHKASAAPQKTKATARLAASPHKTSRLVIAGVLNIRSRPSTSASVVGKLTKGTVLPVTMKGRWAQLGESQWVLAKYLASVTH